MSKLGIKCICRKGNKNSPNQDDYFCLVDGETTILGVFDGHGQYGHYCSNTVQNLLIRYLLKSQYYQTNLELALKEAFLKSDEALRNLAIKEGQFSILLSGTTATVFIKRNKDYCVAHVGDSRAILGKTDKSGVKSHPLTNDHWPSLPSERHRIEESGGEITREDDSSPARIYCKNEGFPGLAMTRALGDDVGKSVGIIAEPEIMVGKVQPGDLFVVLASDGVWEFLGNDKVVGIVAVQGKEKGAFCVAEKAYNEWLDRENGISDDITCIVCYL